MRDLLHNLRFIFSCRTILSPPCGFFAFVYLPRHSGFKSETSEGVLIVGRGEGGENHGPGLARHGPPFPTRGRCVIAAEIDGTEIIKAEANLFFLGGCIVITWRSIKRFARSYGLDMELQRNRLGTRELFSVEGRDMPARRREAG